MNQKMDDIRQQIHQEDISIDYIDDDIIIVDNIHQFTQPDNPLRFRMNTLAACTRGRMQMTMNGNTVQLSEGQLLLLPPDVTIGNFLFSHDFEGKAMGLTNRLIQAFLRDKINIWNEMLYIHKMRVVELRKKDMEFFMKFYDLLRLCIDETEEVLYRTEVIQSLLRGAIIGLCNALHRGLPDSEPVQFRQAHHLLQRFLEILGGTRQKHQSVEHYARQLFITPKYLSAICKRYSGKTAMEWITEYVLEDVRYYLQATDLSVKEISHQMGFPNQSFFGKYVREHTGMTPLQFRGKTVHSS